MARYSSITILHVDDDPGFAEVTANVLEQQDDRFEVLTETDVSAALDGIEDRHLDCVISDYEMDDRDGLDFLAAVRNEYPDLPFILFTGQGSEAVASEAIAAGVTDYLQKQGGTEQYELLANRIANAVESYRARSCSVSLFETTPDPVVEIRLNGDVPVIADANPAFEETFALADDITGQPVVDTIVSEEQFEHETLRRHISRNERVEAEVHRETANGSQAFLLRMIPLGEETHPLGAYIRYTDINEQKQREEELRQLKTFNQEVVENAPVALFRLDEKLRITYENPQARRIVGLPESKEQSDAIGTNIREIPSIADSGMADTFSQLLEGEEIDFEFQFESIYGKTAYVSGRAVPLYDKGDFDGAILMAIDISERKRKERDLQRQNERLEEFANIVSHDLRNPLSVASGNLELLREEYEEQYLDALESSLNRMDQIIEDVLTMARAGQTVEETKLIELSSFARDCWTTVDTKDTELRIDSDVTFEADPGRLQHILENLFRNSVEHAATDRQLEADPSAAADGRAGDDGGVTVRVGSYGDGFYVADDGCGIPDETRERVFEQGFSMADSGTGFGLNIVKQMVEAHGWDIAVVESRDGGARFEIGGVV